MVEEDDSHYLKSVTSLGDTLRIVTNQDVYSKTGIKLASRGSRIDSSFYDKLVRHKLMPVLDECMTAENSVTTEELVSRAKRVFEACRQFSSIPGFVELERIWAVLSKIRLVDALAFKLTVAREKRPELLDHSLRIALLSIYLGLRRDLPETDLEALAMAAVFHDLGELHIDPEILGKSHSLTMDERRHIYAHPMIAYVILKAFREYHPLISTTVLQHHEYLDGSGYPAGLPCEKIGMLSQILGIAEVAGGIPNQDRLEIVLKLNKHKLNTDLIGHVAELLRSGTEESAGESSLADIERRLERLPKAFEDWEALFNHQKDVPIVKFANQRIQELRRALFDAGFNPYEPAWLVTVIEDGREGAQDVDALIQETCWQIRSLSRELNRLWPDFQSSARALSEWIDNSIEAMEN